MISFSYFTHQCLARIIDHEHWEVIFYQSVPQQVKQKMALQVNITVAATGQEHHLDEHVLRKRNLAAVACLEQPHYGGGVVFVT